MDGCCCKNSTYRRAVMKTIWYISGYLGAFLAEIQGALIAVGTLIMMDSFTGIWKAWKNGGWKAVKSRKMGRIVAKLVLYPFALVASLVAQKHLAPDIPWVYVTSGALAVIEIKSIFENIGAILGFNLAKRVKDRLWPDKMDDES